MLVEVQSAMQVKGGREGRGHISTNGHLSLSNLPVESLCGDPMGSTVVWFIGRAQSEQRGYRGSGGEGALHDFLVIVVSRFGPAEDGGLGEDGRAERVFSEPVCHALLEDSEDATLHDLLPSGREGGVRAKDDTPRARGQVILELDLARLAERIHLHRGKAAGGTREEGEHQGTCGRGWLLVWWSNDWVTCLGYLLGSGCIALEEPS